MKPTQLFPWLRQQQTQLSHLIALPGRQQVYLVTTRPPLYLNISKESIQTAIVELQDILKTKGYPIAVSGTFDEATVAVVRQFQKDHQLLDDGVVGALTWTALYYPELRRQDPPELADSPECQDAIATLQDLLEAEKFFTKDPSGCFGRSTERAVKRFQQAYGLHPDGVVGPLTWSVLLGMRQRLSGDERVVAGVYLSRSEVLVLVQEVCIIAFIVLGMCFSPIAPQVPSVISQGLNLTELGKAVTTAIALTCIMPFLPDRLLPKPQGDPRLLILRYAHYVLIGIFSNAALIFIKSKLFGG